MKKFLAMLLVLTMVLALAGTAMAACKIKVGPVKFKKDATTYAAPRESKKGISVVAAKSTAWCDNVCAKKGFARVIVSMQGAKRWFKASALEQLTLAEYNGLHVKWNKGGKNMSVVQTKPFKVVGLKGKVLVSGHTNLRKGPSLECKSQGVVECGDKLTLTGRVGMDDRNVVWVEVCKKGSKLWLSTNFAKFTKDQAALINDSFVLE